MYNREWRSPLQFFAITPSTGEQSGIIHVRDKRKSTICHDLRKFGSINRSSSFRRPPHSFPPLCDRNHRTSSEENDKSRSLIFPEFLHREIKDFYTLGLFSCPINSSPLLKLFYYTLLLSRAGHVCPRCLATVSLSVLFTSSTLLGPCSIQI